MTVRSSLNRKLKTAHTAFFIVAVLSFAGLPIIMLDGPGEASWISALGGTISITGLLGLCFAEYGLRSRVRCPSCAGRFDMKSLGQIFIVPIAVLRTATTCPFCRSQSHDGAKCADCGRIPAEMMRPGLKIKPDAVCCPYCGLSLDDNVNEGGQQEN